MSNKARGTRSKGRREHRIIVIGERREQPDLKRLGRALVELAQAQAEADAEADRQQAEERVAEAAAKRDRKAAS